MKSKKKAKKNIIASFIRKIVMLICIIVFCIVGKVVAEGYIMYRQAVDKISLPDKVSEIRSDNNYVRIDKMTKDYRNAVIAVEDHRFETHHGIDYISTFRAVVRNITTGELSEGGSTITQQLAKNMYFTQEKKFQRKVAELFVADRLEKEYSKDDILEMYINLAYFGNGYYGIGEAARGYLYKEPIQMNLYESTLLAGLPNAPSVYALNSNPQLAKERQNQVLDSMVKYNYISKEKAEEVMSQKK